MAKADGLVVDLSVVMRSGASEYTYGGLTDHILRRQEGKAVFLGAKKLAIVSDTYQNCSIKDTTREARSIGGTVIFNEDDYMPKTSKIKDFFQSCVNKTKLIEIVQKHAVNPLCWQRVWSRSDGVREIMVWQDALHEEADNRILVHVKDMMVQNDCKSIQIRNVDTDVVVIMLAFMPYLKFHDGAVE